MKGDRPAIGLFAESGWYHGARRPSSLGHVIGEGLCPVYSFLSFEIQPISGEIESVQRFDSSQVGPGLPPLSRCQVNRSERPE